MRHIKSPGCAAQGLKPLPISRDFLPQKWLILLFFQNICEMGPSSKYFLDQNGTHVKGFLVKK